MENGVHEIFTFLEDLQKEMHARLDRIEARLERLEKLDSIDHRVDVNQIDLADIKEIVQRLEEEQEATLAHIHKRLDLHLLRIAKAEEDLAILREE